ncbi:hypothetical protein [Streptomyces sp. NBC_01594]|uniref:hypothetical protein n=1 Tax=Streptomyces sp. NBC_01594 TaxID=2975890 RepID=UPI00386C3EFE
MLFGVPTALLILSHLGSAQAEVLERRQARRRGIRELEIFRALLFSVFNGTNVQELKARIDALALAAEGIHHTLDVSFGVSASHERVAALEPLPQQVAAYAQAFSELVPDVDPARWGLWLDEVTAHWEVIDQEVRPRLSELGEPWLSPNINIMMRGWMSELRFGGLSIDAPRFLARVEQELLGRAHRRGRPQWSRDGMRQRIAWLQTMNSVLDSVSTLSRLY